MKYKDWLNEWLTNYVVTTAKPKTIQRYTDIVQRHVIPKLGDCELSELTLIILQRFVTYLMQNGNLKNKTGLAASTVNVIITVVQSSLKTAANVGLLTNYCADGIKRPKAELKNVTCFTLPEQKKIAEFILTNNKYKLYGIVIDFFTGLRIGELLALTWNDVDFKHLTLSVTKTCYDTKNGRATNTPKTVLSKRTIPISKQLIPMLKTLQRNNCSQYVVADKQGKPVSVRSYQRSFELLLKRLNIPHKGFHAIRHTFATRALETGMDVKTLSEILGHKNATITLNRYVHSLMEHKAEMMNRLGKLLN